MGNEMTIQADSTKVVRPVVDLQTEQKGLGPVTEAPANKINSIHNFVDVSKYTKEKSTEEPMFKAEAKKDSKSELDEYKDLELKYRIAQKKASREALINYIKEREIEQKEEAKAKRKEEWEDFKLDVKGLYIESKYELDPVAEFIKMVSSKEAYLEYMDNNKDYYKEYTKEQKIKEWEDFKLDVEATVKSFFED
ncbi:MAG: hypothetical protein R3Y28_06505 [Candidatus Gastranaerophilales bacterium]